MNNIYGVLSYNRSSSKFNSHINSQTSVELIANKMQNLLTKQEPEGAYNTDLHEWQNNCHLNYHMTEKRKLHFPNKHILWDTSVSN